MTLDAPSTTPTRLSVSYWAIDPEYLRARRDHLKRRGFPALSQNAIAAAAGVTHTQIHKVEYGQCGANENVARAIADALRQPVEELFEVRQRSHARDA